MGSLEESKEKIVGRVWQSMAQSGVQLNAIPPEQLQVLVNSIADGVLLALDEMLDDVGLPPRSAEAAVAAGADRPDEGVLWQGRPLLSLIEHYTITSQRLRVTRGLLGKEREDIELVRIQDIDHKQTLGERALNIGDITVRSSDPSHPEVVLRNVIDPQQVHEIMRRAMLEARRRHRFSFQEEM